MAKTIKKLQNSVINIFYLTIGRFESLSNVIVNRYLVLISKHSKLSFYIFDWNAG